MTTMTLATPAAAFPLPPGVTEIPTDPFIYGYRYVARFGPEGERVFVRQPLTLYDVLHPQEDDYRMHSYEHEHICRYLTAVFQNQLTHDPTAVVLPDVRIAWDKVDLEPHTPDIAVVFNVKKYQNWATFSEAQEGTRPILAVEVTSPSTRHLDLETKLEEYEYAELKYYVIVDRYKRRGVEHRRILGYEWTPDGYMALKPDKQGKVWLDPVQVWIAWLGEQLVCYDKSGQLIPNYVQMSQARQEAETRAQEAETRAQEAEARAQAETQARLEIAARLAQVEAELRRLKE